MVIKIYDITLQAESVEKLIQNNINMNISIYYEKKDKYKAIRDLTYHIGNVGVDLKQKQINGQIF